MTTIISKSDIKPAEWDIASSPTTVYHNYDIQEIKNEDGTVEYRYKTDKMTHQEYSLQLVRTLQEQKQISTDLASLSGPRRLHSERELRSRLPTPLVLATQRRLPC